MEWRYRVWGARATHEAILKPSSEAQNSFWIKIALEKMWDNFQEVQLIMLSQVLQVVWQEYVNSEHSKHLSLPQKVFALVASLIVDTIFDNV